MDMDYAYVGRVSGDSITIENASGLGANNVGDVVPLSRTLVAQTLAHGDVVAIEDIDPIVKGLEDIPEFPGYYAYISSPLVIGGATYGAIGFSSKRRMSFKDHDRDFIRLVAALVASAIETADPAETLGRSRLLRCANGTAESVAAHARTRSRDRALAAPRRIVRVALHRSRRLQERQRSWRPRRRRRSSRRSRPSHEHDPSSVRRCPRALGGDEFVVLQPEADLRAGRADARTAQSSTC